MSANASDMIRTVEQAGTVVDAIAGAMLGQMSAARSGEDNGLETGRFLWGMAAWAICPAQRTVSECRLSSPTVSVNTTNTST